MGEDDEQEPGKPIDPVVQRLWDLGAVLDILKDADETGALSLLRTIDHWSDYADDRYRTLALLTPETLKEQIEDEEDHWRKSSMQALLDVVEKNPTYVLFVSCYRDLAARKSEGDARIAYVGLKHGPIVLAFAEHSDVTFKIWTRACLTNGFRV